MAASLTTVVCVCCCCGCSSEDDEAAPPLTLASLVKAELEKYVARGLQEEGGATDPK